MDTVAEAKQKQLDMIDKIMGLPQTQMWRATKDMLLTLRPDIVQIDRDFIQSLNETRNDQLNDFGASKSMDVRQLLDMPIYIYEALITVDTSLIPLLNSGDKAAITKLWRKMAETFPEYRIARKI